MKNVLAKAGIIGASLLPFAAFAQGIEEIITSLEGPINAIIGFIFTLALLIFLWGLLKYVRAGEDDSSKKAARGLILWGIIIIAVMSSVWGLVNLVTGTFELTDTPVTPPDIVTGN